MEGWFLILVSISVALLLKAFFNLLFSPSAAAQNLPPGPPTFPIFGNIAWLRRTSTEAEAILRGLHAKYGPIIALSIGSRPAIFVADRFLAHKALVQNGALFGDRPPALPIDKIVNSNQHNVNSASYGPTWRVLRRNLTAEILHPSRVKSYEHARKWVLRILMDGLRTESKSGPVRVMDHFQYAMFCLLVLMCFGDKLDEKQIKEIKLVQQSLLVGFSRFNVLNFWPKVTKYLLHSRWKEFLQLIEEQKRILVPLIQGRKKLKEESLNKARNDVDGNDHYVLSYVDTLLDLELPDEKRKLKEEDIVSLCSEFLNAGTDTTSTALQWIMANLVKYPELQEKVFTEISGVMSEGEDEVKEEDLHKLPYLKAVILEGLRRHPPGHFVLPHSVTEDVELSGYKIPKNGTINFMVAEMGWDSEVWEEPMAFKPDRFMNGNGGGGGDVFDITGSREIKMMPFGAGRRICPGFGLAMLHLEYFVANLIWRFEWKAVENDDVDLSEKQEFTIVMKNPLQAMISPRIIT